MTELQFWLLAALVLVAVLLQVAMLLRRGAAQ